jgi:bifunctional non-homologous end joining protein LigD
MRLHSRGGNDATRRFAGLAEALAAMPARMSIIDGEVVASNARGLPDFHALHFRRDAADQVCVWAFDLLFYDGKDVRKLPLVERRALLTRFVHRAGNNQLRLSEAFEDGDKLLAATENMGLEGIVSNRPDAPYRSGTKCGWIMVKTQAWREANSERWRLFERRR